MKNGANKWSAWWVALILAGGLAAVRAVTRDAVPAPAEVSATNETVPYSAIWERNVFDLKPPPSKEATNDTKPPEPPANVKLTGITTMFGATQALFIVQPHNKPGQPPTKEQYFSLKEGQRQDGLEVVTIDYKGSKVRIRNDGQESTITFETNHTSGGPGPGGPPPVVMGGAGMPAPGGFGGSPFPNRSMNPNLARGMGAFNNGGGGGGNDFAQGGSGSSGYSPYGVSSGANTSGTTAGLNFGGGTAGATATSADAPALTPQQQIASMAQQAAERAAEIKAGTFPPIPGMDVGSPSPTTTTGSQETTTSSSAAPPGLPSLPVLGSRSSGTLR